MKAEQLEAERDRLKSDIERWKQEYAILLDEKNRLRELSEIQDKYISYLSKSIDDMASLCINHGWVCENYEEGRLLRMQLSELRAGLIDKEVGG